MGFRGVRGVLERLMRVFRGFRKVSGDLRSLPGGRWSTRGRDYMDSKSRFRGSQMHSVEFPRHLRGFMDVLWCFRGVPGGFWRVADGFRESQRVSGDLRWSQGNFWGLWRKIQNA